MVFQNTLYTAIFIGVFAFIATFLNEQFFKTEYQSNFLLALGTAFVAIATCLIIQKLTFNYITSNFRKYCLVLAFPFIYIFLLILSFGSIVTLANLRLYDVGIKYQLWLQGWAFLGKSYIYLMFSPRFPFYLTCLLFMYLLHLAIRANNQQ